MFRFKFDLGVTNHSSTGGPEKKNPVTVWCRIFLSDDETDMVVTLRMNREFMEHMRLYYPEVIKSTYPLFGTIVSVPDILDQNTTNNVDDEDLY